MELFVIWFVTLVATGEEIKSTQAELLVTQHRTSVLEQQYESLAEKHNTLAGKYSARVAAQNITDQGQDGAIVILDMQVNDLQEHTHTSD